MLSLFCSRVSRGPQAHNACEKDLPRLQTILWSTRLLHAIADGLYNLLFADKTGVKIAPKNKNPDFQLCFNFCDEMG